MTTVNEELVERGHLDELVRHVDRLCDADARTPPCQTRSPTCAPGAGGRGNAVEDLAEGYAWATTATDHT